jgi:hypothetical protein
MSTRVKIITKVAACVCMAIIALSSPVLSQDMQRAYTDAELAGVREWEKAWAGKKIDTTNVDQVAQFLPDALVGIIKNPDKWGAPPEGSYFTIKPYEFIPETPGFIAASQANAGKAQLAPDGTIANLGELAGRLFMNPGQDAMKIAWNFDMQNRGDTYHYRRHSPNINPKNKSERVSDQEYWEFYFINRTELDPRPAIAKNPRGYRRGMFLHMYLPPEFLNTRMYTMRYIDHKKEDDSYLWYSQFRRIRRVSTSQRTDAIDGSNLIYDDEYLWDGQLLRNTYAYRGKKDMLTDRHDGVGQVRREAGQSFSNAMSFERCNLLVVDAINKDSEYVYSKRVWYLDPETYYIMWSEMYDKQGRYWRLFFNSTQPLKTETGVMKPVIVGTHFFDLQRMHSGISDQQKVSSPSISVSTITADMFTVSNLQRTH